MVRRAVALAAAALVAAACTRTEVYYKALEKLGKEKREVLVDRVGKARDAQQEAQEQFRDALERYKALVGYRGGELEARYEKLRKEYESSRERADAVRKKIAGVKDVAGSLFREWEDELKQYSDPDLKRGSERELAETRRRYGQLVVTMEKAASRMDPVLAKLNDQVLFLKHNLNARALGALGDTANTLQAEVDSLVREMEASIGEADAFVREMKPASEP